MNDERLNELVKNVEDCYNPVLKINMNNGRLKILDAFDKFLNFAVVIQDGKNLNNFKFAFLADVEQIKTAIKSIEDASKFYQNNNSIGYLLNDLHNFLLNKLVAVEQTFDC